MKKYISYANSQEFDRSDKTISEKAANPVYVRRGSEVTYTIVISVKIPCTLSFTDTYDSELSWVSSSIELDSSHRGSHTFTSTNKSYSFTVTLQLDEDVESSNTKKYANRISINNSDPSLYDEDYIGCKYTLTITPEVDSYSLTAKIYKYIISTTSNSSVEDRSGDTNSTKSIYPETVVKGDTVTYEIKVENTSEEIVGSEYGLSAAGVVINSITLKDQAEDGLEPSASSVTLTNIPAGESATTTITCEVTMSDMYLYTLYNEVVFSSGTYGKVVIDKYVEVWTETISNNDKSTTDTTGTETWYQSRIEGTDISSSMIKEPTTYNRDYVQLEDVEIAGDVWLDSNGDGLNNDDNPFTEVRVYLYKNDALSEETTVDSSGHYTFGLQEKGNTPFGSGTRKYADSSGYNEYYVLFEYFGNDYENTTYANGSAVTDSGYTDSNWEIESHTCEANVYDDNRQDFNDTFETISYDTAWAGTSNTSNYKALEYNKDRHISDLTWTDSTTIQAKSIVLYLNYGSAGGTETSKADYVQYLKHINLGLVERTQADLSVTKDVVKTYMTINGNETTYTYEDGATNTETYHIETPYKMYLYYEDYAYRTESYDDEIATILGGASNDLQIKITYKIVISNDSTEDYKAVVREVIDIYSEALEIATDEYDDKLAVYDEDGNKLDVSESIYNSKTSYSYSGYKVSYITGSTLEQTLAPGETFTFYIDYNVGKTPDSGSGISFDVNTSGAIILNDKVNIAQVGAYSIYNSDGTTVAGVVDGDSNPGNVVIYEGLDDYDQYEDTIYETDIQILLRTGDDPDDPGDPSDPGDPDDPDDPKDPGDPPENIRVITGNVWEDMSGDGSVDFTAQGSNKTVTQYTGDGVKNNEDISAENITVILMEVIRDGDDEYLVYTGIATRSRSDGTYYLYDATRLHAGEYVVRFVYGEDEDTYTIYNGGDTIKYSGQDYKSTIYTDVTDDTGEEPVESNAFAEAQNGEIKSVAEDNELRRLEVINYSTTMTYELDNILKGGDDLATLADNTYMYADTNSFNVRIEEYSKYEENGSLEGWMFIGGKVIQYEISEVNFGLVERPRTMLITAKDISQITATTSDGSVLVDLIFDVYYYTDDDSDYGFEHTSILNKQESTGYDNVQILNRSANNQGFRYINVDSELLQGMTVTVTYQIGVGNTSEIDSSYENLVNMVKDYAVGDVASDMKTALGNFASKTYRYNSSSETGDVNDLLLSCTTSNIRNYASSAIGDYTNSNYEKYDLGYFVGRIYYTGEENGEVAVETRVDQIVDYIDNDLILDLADNVDENGYGKFVNYTTEQIEEYNLLKGITADTRTISDGQSDYMIFESSSSDTITKNNIAFSIEDGVINNTLYRYLKPLLAVETSTVEYVDNINTKEENGEITIEEELGTLDDVYSYDDIYTIKIQASRTLSSEEDADGLTIDNVSEIVKITNTVGRKVYVDNGDDSSVGNIGDSVETVEEMYSDDNPEVTIKTVVGQTDTDYTEFITFSPPTGLSNAQVAEHKAVKTVVIIVILAILASGGLGTTIKLKTKKKFYR